MQELLIDKPWFMVLVILIFLWSLPWKGVALWMSARRGHLGWFIVLMILNTLAILDILYIFIFSKSGKSGKPEEKSEENMQQNFPKSNIKKMIA